MDKGKRYPIYILVFIFAVIAISHTDASMRLFKTAVWAVGAKLLDKSGHRREATLAMGVGGADNIWDLVEHCTTATNEKVDPFQCAKSVFTSTVAMGFAVLRRVYTRS